MRIPGRGEIWHVNLNPVAGKEQQGSRPVMVVSDKEFNRSGLVLIVRSHKAASRRGLPGLQCH